MGLQRYGLFFAGILIIALVAAAPVSAAPVITIDNTTPNALRDAVDSGSYPIIILNPGIYFEHDITIPIDIIIQANTSYGGGPDNTIIDAGNSRRIFDDRWGYALEIDSLTLTGGNAGTDNGGAIYTKGGSITLISSVISDCRAYSGGAIDADTGSSVTITSSTISGCSASYDGGAIHNSGTLTVNMVHIISCSAADGGAIGNSGTADIVDSAFSGCTASAGGGAIQNDGSMSIRSSEFSGCSSGQGGAILNVGMVGILSSAFTGCNAGSGGAIFNFNSDDAIITSLRFSRFSGNSATGAGKTIYNSFRSTISDATDTWWGTNSDPSSGFSGVYTYDPWLQLGGTAAPSAITAAHASVIRANLTFDTSPGDTSASGYIPDRTPVEFRVVSGPGALSAASNATTLGAAETTMTPTGTGTVNISVKVDSQIVYIEVPVTDAPVPAISRITPDTGINTSSVTITDLAGTDFWMHGTTVVRLNRAGESITATGVRVLSPAQITCTLPITGAEAGAWDVLVINPDGKEAGLHDAFTITAPAPLVSGITPGTGMNTSAVSITDLHGSWFQTGAVVNLTRAGHANITATDVSVVSNTQITCSLPIAGAEAGSWDVVVTNPDGKEAILTRGFTITVPAPVVSGITPGTGMNTSAVSITDLHGSWFQTGAVVNLTRAGHANITATGVSVVSNTQITCSLPIAGAEAGSWDVVVTNPDGKEGVLPGRFTITAPAPTTAATTAVYATLPDSNDDGFPSVTPTTTQAGSLPLMTVTVNIGGNSKAWQAVVTGTKLSDLIVTGTVQPGSGFNVTAPPGIVYQYISLVPARYTSITRAVIHFTVPQVWLDENHIAPGSIVLYHQTANGWEVLPTTVLSTKDGTVYFSAESAGFSLFAIAGAPQDSIIVDIARDSPERSIRIDQPPAPAAVVTAPVTTQTIAPPPAATPESSGPSAVLTIVLVIAAIGILAGGGFMVRRWWIRRQNPALFADYD